MGKRELLLIIIFAAIGSVVYQLTAAPPPPGREGFSLRRIFDHVRREMQGQNFKVDVSLEAKQAVPPSVVALNILETRGRLTVVGEDRADVVAHLDTEVYGPDERTARADAAAVKLVLAVEGAGMNLRIARPSPIPNTRRSPTVLRVAVPSRLAISLEGNMRAEFTKVAQVTINTRHGDITAQEIAGEVRGTLRDAELSVTRARGVAVDLRGVSARLEAIGRGGVKGEYVDGRALLRDVAGDILIEWRRTDVEFERATGRLRLKGTDGSALVREAAGAIQFEGTRASLTVQATKPAPVEARSTDARVELRLPPDGGVTLDLSAEDGRVEAPEGLAPTVSNGDQQLSSKLGGGGPTWFVRTRRADIVIKK